MGYIPVVVGYKDDAIQLVDLLLSYSAKPDGQAIVQAAWNHNNGYNWDEFTEFADYLFSKGAILYDNHFPENKKNRLFLEVLYVNARDDLELAVLRGDLKETKRLVAEECESHNPIDYFRCQFPRNASHQRALMIAITRGKTDIVDYLVLEWDLADKLLYPNNERNIYFILNCFTLPGALDTLIWLMRGHSLQATDLNTVIQYFAPDLPAKMRHLTQ